MSKALVSLCVPVFNEEDNVQRLYEALTHTMTACTGDFDYEIVITDNHSTDRTFELLEEIAQRDSRLRVIRFSRNFGFQRSVLTAFREARGNCAIQLDADLQDPPSLIPCFLDEWKKGAKVVYGIRRQRQGDNWFVHLLRRAFYRLINLLSEDDLPHDAGDFRLVDRVILDELQNARDQTPYVRGQIAAMGFRQVGIPYDRAERVAGESKFPLYKLVGLAMDGILNHSIVPLRIATYAGLAFSFLSVLGMLYYFVQRLFFRHDWPEGLASTSILILFLIGLNAMFLGILGEYVGRIYLNIRNRPLVIIEQRIESIHSNSRNAGP